MLENYETHIMCLTLTTVVETSSLYKCQFIPVLITKSISATTHAISVHCFDFINTVSYHIG